MIGALWQHFIGQLVCYNSFGWSSWPEGGPLLGSPLISAAENGNHAGDFSQGLSKSPAQFCLTISEEKLDVVWTDRVDTFLVESVYWSFGASYQDLDKGELFFVSLVLHVFEPMLEVLSNHINYVFQSCRLSGMVTNTKTKYNLHCAKFRIVNLQIKGLFIKIWVC